MRPVVRTNRFVAAVLAGTATLLVAACAPPPTTVAAPGSCAIFPATNVWHAKVSTLPVHPKSSTYVSSIGSTAHVHADFGSGTWNGGPIGIPYDIVGAGQPQVTVTFDYDDESDHVGYPIPSNASIEGG